MAKNKGTISQVWDRLFFGYSRLPKESAPLRVKRRSGILASLEEGIYSQAWITLTSGKFLTDLALHFGAAAIHLGLINAIPFLAAPAQLLGAHLVTVFGSRKKVLIPSAFITRQLWWIVLVLVFLPLSGMTKIWLFCFLFIIMHISGQVSGNAWLSWLGDLLPDNLRGRVISARNGILIFVAMGADFVVSQVREALGESHRHVYFIICLSIAAFAGLKSIFAFQNQWEPPFSPRPVPRMRSIFRQMFALIPVRRLMASLMVWNIAVGVAMAFWAPHMMVYLKMSFTTIFLYSSVVMICNFFMTRLIWGRVIDRAGTVSVVTFCASLISFIPIIWLFISPGNITLIWFEAVINGLSWSGFNVAIFNLPYFILPKENRSYFFAFLSGASGLALGVGAVLGGVIAQALSNMHLELSGMIYNNYHAVFLLSAVLRAACILLLRKVPDSRGRGMVFMLKTVGDGLVRLRSNPRLLLFSRLINNQKKREAVFNSSRTSARK